MFALVLRTNINLLGWFIRDIVDYLYYGSIFRENDSFHERQDNRSSLLSAHQSSGILNINLNFEVCFQNIFKDYFDHLSIFHTVLYFTWSFILHLTIKIYSSFNIKSVSYHGICKNMSKTLFSFYSYYYYDM